MTFTRTWPSWLGQDDDVRLAEDDEEVALAGVLEIVGHVQVGVHAGLQHGDAAELAEFRGVCLVVEGAGDQHIETASPASRAAATRSARCTVPNSGPMKMAARFSVPPSSTALRRRRVAGPGGERGESDPVFLVRLLHAGGLEVLQDHLVETHAVSLLHGERIDQLVVLIHAEHAVGREALDGERARNADLLLVVVGLVVEVLEFGLGGDGGVDLLLPGNACLPPVGVQLLRGLRPFLLGFARNLPFLPGLLERRVQLLAQRLQLRLPLVPDHIDLGVVGDGFERDVRHALIDEAVADVAVYRL